MNYGPFPKQLKPFLSTDEARPFSAPIITPDGWEALNGHSLAWQRAKHATPVKEATYISGVSAGEKANCLADLLAYEFQHPYTCVLALPVLPFVCWEQLWPAIFSVNVELLGKTPKVHVVRDIPKSLVDLSKKFKSGGIKGNVTIDGTASLAPYGLFDELAKFVDITHSKGISARYLSEAMQLCGGHVYASADAGELSPWIVSPLKNEPGTVVAAKDLLEQETGVVVMPVKT